MKKGVETPADKAPKSSGRREQLNVNPALAELLRVLLKANSERAGVAQKLIATTSELDSIAAGERTSLALTGWRHEVFGQDALRLCDGKLALAVKGEKVRAVEI